MLTEIQSAPLFLPDAVEIVLVRPRNPLNIGAAARAMANFGFTHLTVVAPYEPRWREARSAVDSHQILREARCTATIAEAVAQASLVLGTGSLTYRKPEQSVLQLPTLAPLVHTELASAGHIALLFGPENHGLTREDLSWCHHLIEIPTSPLQPSMNLGQAVAVTLYEFALHIFTAPFSLPSTPAEPTAPPPTERKQASADLDILAQLIERTMEAAHYSPAGMQEANRHDLRLSLRRMVMTRHDLRRALGLFRRILYALRNNGV